MTVVVSPPLEQTDIGPAYAQLLCQRGGRCSIGQTVRCGGVNVRTEAIYVGY